MQKGNAAPWVSASVTAIAVIVALWLGISNLHRVDEQLRLNQQSVSIAESSMAMVRQGLRQTDSSLALTREANTTSSYEARITIEASLRPYVRCEISPVKRSSRRINDATVDVTLTNAGKTTAYAVSPTQICGGRNLEYNIDWPDSGRYILITPEQSVTYPGIVLENFYESSGAVFWHIIYTYEYRFPSSYGHDVDSVTTFVSMRTEMLASGDSLQVVDEPTTFTLGEEEIRLPGRHRKFTLHYSHPYYSVVARD